MFGLFKKREITSAEYESLLLKVKPLIHEVDILKGRFDQLETNFISLRQSINKKLAGKTIAQEEDADHTPKGGVYLNEEEVKALQEQLSSMGYQSK